MKKKIYLAHSLGSRDYIKEYIQPIINKYFKVYNPFHGRVLVGNEDEVRGAIEDPLEIVSGDLKLIDKCDGVIAYFADQPSFGTTFEIAYARTHKKPVMVVYKNTNHPWLRVYSTLLCDHSDFEQGLFKFEELVESGYC